MPTFRALHALLAAAGLSVLGCAGAAVKPDPAPVADLAPEAPPPTPAQEFERGVAAHAAGRYEESEAIFREVLKAQPQSANVRFDVALALERQGRLDEARTTYEEVLSRHPGHVPTLLNLGALYRRSERVKDAISLYERALEGPERARDPALLTNLSVAYRLDRQFAKAEAAARRVLERSKDDPAAYKNLALIYLDQGNYPLARFVTEKAAALDAQDPGVYNTHGLILLALGEREAALAQFKKAVSLSESFAPAHVNLGALALRYRDYAAAESSFTRAAELDPTSAETQRHLAWALDGQKGRDPKKGLAAGAAYEKVLSLKGEDREALCGAGWAYAADREGFARARPLLERCRDLPDTAPVDRARIDSRLKAMEGQAKAAPAAAPAPADEASP